MTDFRSVLREVTLVAMAYREQQAMPDSQDAEWDAAIERAMDLLMVWSDPCRALWLGAALGHLAARAVEGDEDAKHWIEQVPADVKAQWPGVFSEYPYEGESSADHAARRASDARVRSGLAREEP